MIYAEILSAGNGTRMGYTEMPKQFLKLGEKPIIIHTIEKFLLIKEIDCLIIVVGEKWKIHTIDLIKKYIPKCFIEKIHVCVGGQDRSDSISKGIDYIESKFGIDKTDIIVTHDAVRPFVTSRIIKENIDMAIKYGATDTVIPAYDTIVESKDGEFLSAIPNRNNMYQGQTPQSFNILKLKELYLKLKPEEKEMLTDCAKVFSINNEKVKIVNGESFNIKITNQYDFKIANLLIRGIDTDDK